MRDPQATFNECCDMLKAAESLLADANWHGDAEIIRLAEQMVRRLARRRNELAMAWSKELALSTGISPARNWR